MKGKSTASNIAKYIIYVFQDVGDWITNMKVQKLLYYVQGWHLANHQACAFDEELEAWVHGPVVPQVYQEYKDYRWRPITHEIPKPPLDKAIIGHIDIVLDSYGGENAYSLEARTHNEYPWVKARGNLDRAAECHNIISKSSMQKYFTMLQEDSNETERS